MNVKSLSKRICLVTGLCLCVTAFGGCGDSSDNSKTTTNTETTTAAEASGISNTNAITVTDTFADQTIVDESLQKEAANGYTLENPFVVVNPYGTSPLTAVVIFSTEDETTGTITVKGKTEKDDVTGTIPAARDHIVPIYGLYDGATTQVVIELSDGSSNTIDVTTEDSKLLSTIGEIETEMLDESAYDYSCLTFAMSCTGSVYALDSSGDIRWYYAAGGALGMHQLSNGHLMLPTQYTLKTSYYKSGLQEIDLTGKVYREYAIPGGMHHDFQELSNGNLLVASDSQDLTKVEDHVVEIDAKTGEVVWELNMADLLDTEDGRSASMTTDGSEEVDWYHNNAVWYDEKNDLVLMSARHVDAIVAVHKTEKTLAWILGDPTGWEKVDSKYFFTPVGDNFEWQYAQHQVTMLDNGDIMMFDNGTAKVKNVDADKRVTGDAIYSRAVVYRIDTEKMTIEQVFEYGKERGPEWYSDWISGSVSLDGTANNLWITAGSNLYNKETGSHDYGPTGMFQTSLIKSTHINQVVNGKLVYELVISSESASSLTYRSFRMPMYNEGSDLDVEAKSSLIGSLGQTKTADADVKIENAKDLDTTGWTFLYDGTKFTVKGNYASTSAADQIKEGYLVLKNGDNVLAYAITQTASESENGVTVIVTGWVAPDGLEGSNYDVYLVLDGTLYNTGSYVAF